MYLVLDLPALPSLSSMFSGSQYPKAQNQEASEARSLKILSFRFKVGTHSIPSHSVGYRVSLGSTGIKITPDFCKAKEGEITKNL